MFTKNICILQRPWNESKLTYYHVIVTRVRDNLGLSEARALAHAAGLLTAQS